MKKIKKLISLMLCILLVLPSTAFAAEQNSDLIVSENQANMVDILLESTEDYYIVVSVPADKATEYQNMLVSDTNFKNEEIESALSVNTVSTCALPEGPIEYQSYLYIDDIQAAVDSYSGTGTFAKFMTAAGWAITAADIAKLVKLSGKANVFLLAANILGTLVQWAQEEREAWWNQALRDICNGKITAVRYTIVQNIKSEYPKIWRVFERI